MLTSIDYSDSTPDVAITYDALGRTTQVSNGLAKSTYLFDPATLVLDTETITYDLNTDGTPDLLRVLDRKQDSLLRDTGFDLKNGSSVENQAIYGYDSAGRLSTVTDAANTFTYGYQYNQTTAADPRIGSTTGTKQDFVPYTLTKSGSPVLQTIRTYEARRDTLATIQNNAGTIPRSSYTYTVNPLGQRTDLTTTFDLGVGLSANPGDTAWGYDGLGQLKSAAAPGTAADRYFAYDAIGNRLESRNESATNLGGTLTEYFGKLTPSPEPGANAINQYVGIKKSATTIEPGYDDDGNATAYPVSVHPTANTTLGWDAENRLVSATVNGVVTTHLYDAQSRKITTTTGSTTTLYLYDAWNCIAEYQLHNSSFNLHTSRLWGMDLSGSMQGAGGVGGLLSESSLITSTPITFNTFFLTYDGNGNVSEYLAADGTTAAHFEYDPFGNTVVNTDTNNQFSYRFSTKPLDQTTGLYYYGYRYYDPLTGGWPSRDPIGERGGINLYGFVGNSGVNRFDRLGLVGSITIPGSSQGWGSGSSGSSTGSGNSPTPFDNNTIFTDDGGSTDQTAWFDQNYGSQVEAAKQEAIDSINGTIKKACMGRRMQTPSFSKAGYASDSWLDGVSVGSFAFQVEKGSKVNWNGFKWSWDAELLISDTVGFDWGDSIPENVFVVLFGWNIGRSKQIYRASWNISGSGECKCDYPYEAP